MITLTDAEYDGLQARIAALEAALREIVALYDDEDWPDDSGAMLQPLEIARAALATAETGAEHE